MSKTPSRPIPPAPVPPALNGALIGDLQKGEGEALARPQDLDTLLTGYLTARGIPAPVITTGAKTLEEAHELVAAITDGDQIAIHHEIADVVLAAAAVARHYGVSVEAAIAEKTAYDAGRGDKTQPSPRAHYLRESGSRIAPPDPAALARVVAAALAEDLSRGDPTSTGLFGERKQAIMSLLVKEPGVLCGLPALVAVFAALDKNVVVTLLVGEGEHIGSAPREVARISGPARALLAGERTALNLVGRLSGIASSTARALIELEGTGAILLDTRKTTPGLRELEKYAVRTGGGLNHRRDLGEAILVKDNHLNLVGGPDKIAAVVARLRAAHPTLLLEVEAENLDQVEAALAAGVDRILLDNMSLDELRAAVALVDARQGGWVETEASGGITLANLRQVGQTGVDYVSLGALTHSAHTLDVSLEVVS